MRASLPRPARSSPRPPSIVPACVRSVSQQACAERLLCARPVLAAGATVGADAGSCGTQGGETQPSKPGARCCTPHTRMWTGPARPSGACAPGSARRPWPPTPTYLPSPGRGNSDPSLVPTSSRFSPPSDAECNPCIFSDWSKKEKKKSSFTRRAFTSHGKVCYTRCSGGPSLGGATANPGLPKRWLSASGTPGQAQSSACGTRPASPG